MIEDPPILTLRRRFDRPDAARIRPFRGVPAANIVDAMAGRGALDRSIKPLLAPGAPIVGPALTAFAYPADNLALFACLDLVQEGDIVVCATDGYRETALTGDLLAGMLRNAGAAALVTDGAIRDQSGIAGMGLPVWHGGVTPNSPARVGPGTVGLPVVCGGVPVRSGDLIVADRDGVVVVPQDDIDAVGARLPAILEAERALETEVRNGMARPPWLAGLMAPERIREIE